MTSTGQSLSERCVNQDERRITTLVLLPGMDGTGALFGPFLSCLPSDWKICVVSYSTDVSMDYAQLTKHAQQSLPAEGPFWLLGESFSGPIAMALAARNGDRVQGLVLVCTFVRSPRSWGRVLTPLLRWVPHPTRMLVLVGQMLMGRHTTHILLESLRVALASVSSDVFRRRTRSVLQVDATNDLKAARCPLLYLQATEDRIVGSHCANDIVAAQPHTKVVALAGPHFLLQTQAAACAQAVGRFIAAHRNSPHTAPHE